LEESRAYLITALFSQLTKKYNKNKVAFHMGKVNPFPPWTTFDQPSDFKVWGHLVWERELISHHGKGIFLPLD
jgi:hypothetical protein